MNCKFQLFSPMHTDPTLTLANLTQLLNTVDDWDAFSKDMNIPDSKYEDIKEECPDGDEWKEAICEWYLANHPAPSWRDVAIALYVSEEHTVLDVLRMDYLKGQCTCITG